MKLDLLTHRRRDLCRAFLLGLSLTGAIWAAAYFAADLLLRLEGLL